LPVAKKSPGRREAGRPFVVAPLGGLPVGLAAIVTSRRNPVVVIP